MTDEQKKRSWTPLPLLVGGSSSGRGISLRGLITLLMLGGAFPGATVWLSEQDRATEQRAVERCQVAITAERAAAAERFARAAELERLELQLIDAQAKTRELRAELAELRAAVEKRRR